jgi:hypothetical protein
MKRATLAAALIVASCGLGHAQKTQPIEWKQMANTPKGLNLPSGVKVDIIGFELGEPYSEARAKLAAYFKEALKDNPKPPPADPYAMDDFTPGQRINEERTQFRLQAPNQAAIIDAVFVSNIHTNMSKERPGRKSLEESIKINLSAPSSGHQVLGIERHVHFPEASDQPRISEVIAMLSQKLGGQPQVISRSPSTVVRYQYNNGKLFVPARSDYSSCMHRGEVVDQAALREINPSGDCDVVYELTASHGISPDHASHLKFQLSDNERAKANGTADYAFFSSYIKSLQQNVKGAAPKL